MTQQWIERWEEGRTGWHEPQGNRGLKVHWTATGRHVLVPLCGKASDLAWLARLGNSVTGVELSPLAVESFFAEHNLDYTIDDSARLPTYVAAELPLRIVCGDYFDFDETGFDAHYDRGALVALPPDQRAEYCRHTLARLSPDALQCVVTVHYSSEEAVGPPFVVAEAELLSAWPSLELRDCYDDSDAMPPRFRELGISVLEEKVWMTPR